MTLKIVLGRIDNETVSLTKHQWDCGWYWGFGYVGNHSHHFHIESLMEAETDVNKIFDKTWLTQKAWWTLRDLFIQAYGLKKAAEIYRHGGHQMTVAGLTDVLQLQEKADIINVDLGILLDKTWDFMVTEKADFDAKKDILNTLEQNK